MVCRAGLELLSRQPGREVENSKLFNILKLMVPLAERPLVELEHVLSLANTGAVPDALRRLNALARNNTNAALAPLFSGYHGLLEAAMWEST